MGRMRDKIVLITGASEGIGRATAELIAAEGGHVVIAARRPEPLEETRAAIAAAGGSVEAHRLDVSDLDAYAALIADVAKRHGRLDVLINNAMSATYKSLVDLTIEDWRRDFSVNGEAVFVGTREAMKLMVAAGRGSIVNISSACGMRAMPGMPSYSASKAALIHFSACAAIEGAPHGVRVNSIVPGQIATPATLQFQEYAPAAAKATTAAIPMERSGDPKELAQAVLFLASDESSYVTGVALPVDGGKTMQLYMPS
ncbi:NAD(P)-dependent dehydrogenase, short-chain alcohol dehydrogenase family [Sphingomonas laterariae]|uniref:NAD(P)-dependent dehydrogenase, short-chain alcohol dehydrogenase family n=1 Tax=Edaphosphingomonas laterariae TaxID=861865 RepID=A0A239GZ69_9SPHN|nr:SDR family oxidoreductase [Sphingomonas laterariae]SNS74201.1 NAD(P)-dependent dehydrogenase, short-chain alcohol dehydrogenase family [Sphingomonas laterariae]